MVLEYFNQSGMLRVPLPNIGLHEIARAMRWSDGVWAPDVPAINPFLEEAVPSIEFEDEYRVRRVDEIDEEIANKRPCIAFLELTDGVHRVWHAVTVTHIDIERNHITYNDPGPPIERSGVPLSSFEKEWRGAYTTLLKVQIGKHTRTTLPEFGVGVAPEP